MTEQNTNLNNEKLNTDLPSNVDDSADTNKNREIEKVEPPGSLNGRGKDYANA